MSEPASRGGRRIVRVDALARVEGEGALHVRIKDGVVENVEFRIYEPPRFFEAFLVGRAFGEVVEVSAMCTRGPASRIVCAPS